MNLQPYQAASEQVQDQAKQPSRMVKSALGVAASLSAAGAVGARVLPFLSSFIPSDIAIKGISKVSPQLGNFIKGTVDKGYATEEVLNFVKNKISGEEEDKNKAPDQRNIIEQYSPSIFGYIGDLIKGGSTPVQAAQKAKKFLDAKAKSIITQMEQDHKTPFESIVESIFGGGQMAQKNPEAQQPEQIQQQAQPQQMQQGQPQQNQSGANWGQVAQQLQNILKM